MNFNWLFLNFKLWNQSMFFSRVSVALSNSSIILTPKESLFPQWDVADMSKTYPRRSMAFYDIL